METLHTLIGSARLAVGHTTIVRGGVDSLTSGSELLHSKRYKEGYSQSSFRAVLTFHTEQTNNLSFFMRKGENYSTIGTKQESSE